MIIDYRINIYKYKNNYTIEFDLFNLFPSLTTKIIVLINTFIKEIREIFREIKIR